MQKRAYQGLTVLKNPRICPYTFSFHIDFENNTILYSLLIISFPGKHQRLFNMNTPFESKTTSVLKELMARFAQIITLASQAS